MSVSLTGLSHRIASAPGFGYNMHMRFGEGICVCHSTELSFALRCGWDLLGFQEWSLSGGAGL